MEKKKHSKLFIIILVLFIVAVIASWYYLRTWPLRLSEWKLAKGVRQITPYQAKRFSKYYREEAEK